MILHEYVGQTVDDRYILNECVGSGATGVVFRATQKVVDREVALKLLKRAATDDENYRARFEREAKVLGRLDHAAFVRVFDFGWYEELSQPYLVTEFVGGQPLAELMNVLSPRDFIAAVRRVTSALEHAHENMVAHRDLKPDNILIPSDEGPEGAKVVDFGLAGIMDNSDIRVTQKGDAFGTPAYMSPEQCVGDDNIGPATDVYSLGCVVFEYFEGELPYFASTASRVMIKHVTKPIPTLSDPELPKELVELVREMMSKTAEYRPTMSELRDRLTAFLDDDGATWLGEPRDTKPSTVNVYKETIRTTRRVALVDPSKDYGEDSQLDTEPSAIPVSKGPSDTNEDIVPPAGPEADFLAHELTATQYSESRDAVRPRRWPIVVVGALLVGLIGGLLLLRPDASDRAPTVAETPPQPTEIVAEETPEAEEMVVAVERPEALDGALSAARTAAATAGELEQPTVSAPPAKEPVKKFKPTEIAAKTKPVVAKAEPKVEAPESPAPSKADEEAEKKKKRREAKLRY